ncbi:conserved membrane hypothetical protein [Rubrivivax sp. A210]|uniref:DUF3429 domain-containing protein n=1 Tax=Rubrivivax sp. A210 TaxID=2772301 RepID=UPI00191AF2B9|nr:DUF3429 domain-containing protein [Rubrivivax sp. A210]CAD5372646.1 conserved membrane hypothetical protein [Rubrivivax sp. A210]
MTTVPASSSAPAESDPDRFALRLGYAGLAPFVLGAALMWLVYPEVHPYVALALSSYAAVVISFLGGIHWGMAMRHQPPPHTLIAWGVVPSLLAWAAVMMPPASGLVIAALALLACYGVDRRLYPLHGAAHWLTLRFRLSMLAALSCFIGAAGA